MEGEVKIYYRFIIVIIHNNKFNIGEGRGLLRSIFSRYRNERENRNRFGKRKSLQYTHNLESTTRTALKVVALLRTLLLNVWQCGMAAPKRNNPLKKQ